LPYALAIYRPGPAGFGFVLQVIKDLLDHYRVFNAGDDFHGAAAAAAGLDVDIENTLEPLRPCHRRSPLCWCCRFISHPDLVAPAPFCRRDQRPVPTVGCEHPAEAGWVDSGRRYQGGQPGNEIQSFENDVRGAVPVRRLELLAPVASARYLQPLLRCPRAAA